MNKQMIKSKIEAINKRPETEIGNKLKEALEQKLDSLEGGKTVTKFSKIG